MGSWMQDNMFLLIIVFGVVLILIVLLLLLILRRRKRSDEELLEEADGEDELEVEAVEVKTVEGGIEADEGTGSRMELAAEEMKRMEETFEGCREAGMDLTPYKERYEEIRDAVNIEDPEMTAAEITEFITKLDEAYYAYFDELKARAKKLHETLNNEFRKAASHGIDVKGFRGDYESGIKCFKGRDFQGAIELFRYVLDALGGQGEEKAGTAQYEAGEEGTAVDETSLAITDDRTVETAEATAEVTAEAAVREEVKAREKPAPVRKVQRKVIRPAAKKVNLDSLFAQIQPRGGGSSTGDAAETAGEGEVTGSE